MVRAQENIYIYLNYNLFKIYEKFSEFLKLKMTFYFKFINF